MLLLPASLWNMLSAMGVLPGHHCRRNYLRGGNGCSADSSARWHAENDPHSSHFRHSSWLVSGCGGGSTPPGVHAHLPLGVLHRPSPKTKRIRSRGERVNLFETLVLCPSPFAMNKCRMCCF